MVIFHSSVCLPESISAAGDVSISRWQTSHRFFGMTQPRLETVDTFTFQTQLSLDVINLSESIPMYRHGKTHEYNNLLNQPQVSSASCSGALKRPRPKGAALWPSPRRDQVVGIARPVMILRYTLW